MKQLFALVAAKGIFRGLEKSYRDGNFSGHPEDILWNIEDAKNSGRSTQKQEVKS